jgi:hypothetical protein
LFPDKVQTNDLVSKLQSSKSISMVSSTVFGNDSGQRIHSNGVTTGNRTSILKNINCLFQKRQIAVYTLFGLTPNSNLKA